MKVALVSGLTFVGLIGLAMMNTSTSWAQSVATPNATVSALQTQVATWQSDVPNLEATRTAARVEAEKAARDAQAQDDALRVIQDGINRANAAINAGLGQQALDLASRAALDLQPIINAATPAARQLQAGLDSLATAEAAYTNALPRLVQTAQAYPVKLQAAVQGQVDSLNVQVENLQSGSQRAAQSLTTWRIVSGVLAVVAMALGVVIWKQRAHRAVSKTAQADRPEAASESTDADRLPQGELQFDDSPELVEYFDRVHQHGPGESTNPD
jgi:hypothetical protein